MIPGIKKRVFISCASKIKTVEFSITEMVVSFYNVCRIKYPCSFICKCGKNVKYGLDEEEQKLLTFLEKKEGLFGVTPCKQKEKKFF